MTDEEYENRPTFLSPGNLENLRQLCRDLPDDAADCIWGYEAVVRKAEQRIAELEKELFDALHTGNFYPSPPPQELLKQAELRGERKGFDAAKENAWAQHPYEPHRVVPVEKRCGCPVPRYRDFADYEKQKSLKEK